MFTPSNDVLLHQAKQLEKHIAKRRAAGKPVAELEETLADTFVMHLTRTLWD
jgi:hypothetical protein